MAFTDQFSQLSFPDLGLVRFPTVTISQEDRAALGLKPNANNRTVLKQLAWDGFLAHKAKGHFKGISEETAIAQFKTEFETFDKTGVHDYLLLVWDINRWCDQKKIVRGWGRGSAASSLTLYCLNITRVNPIRHNLNFPRFISEARMKPVVKNGVTYIDGKMAPDIDCDYQYGRRVEVLQYIEEKYAGHTSKISTRLELTGKTALKNTLKVFGGYNDNEAQQVSDFIEARFGKVQDLHEAKEKNKEIIAWLAKDPRHREMYDIAMAIEGLAVAKGMHPSGVFISFHPLDGSIPTELSKTGDVYTAYDMETVAGLGFKVDILGVRTLDLVADTARLVGESLETLDIDDPEIYSYLTRTTNYAGLFQIEDGTTKDAVMKVGPKDIDALSVCLAISRPGALRYLDQYAEYSRKGTLKTIFPAIDNVLQPTGNVLVFQEQITQICNEVFSLSLIDADQVRYAVGKKKKEEMAKWEPVLEVNGKGKNIPVEAIKYFWDVCNASADYLFVKSHAISYAYLTAATVYYKAKYPQAFYLVMLRLAREEPDSMTYMNAVIKEMNSVGIKILPPDILYSDSDFTIEADETGAKHIRFGLSHIRGISDSTMKKLLGLRGTQFQSKFELFEAAKWAGIDIRVLASLIFSGCLNWKGTPRTKLALEAQTYNLLTDTQKVKVKQFAKEYNEDVVTILRELPNRLNEKGRPLIPESQIDTIRKKHGPYWDMYQVNARNEEMCSYMMERHFLGFSYSGDLHTIFSKKVANLLTLSQVKAKGVALKNAPPPPPLKPGEKPVYPKPIHFVAFVEYLKFNVSAKNGSPYLRGEVRDDTGSFMVMVYGEEKLEACKRFNGGKVPVEGDIVLVSGTLAKDGAMIFADSCLVQPNPIVTKRSTVEVSA